ncbi:MAG: DUF3592 domain-containing protein [Hyphomicrobiaceae bacterium]
MRGLLDDSMLAAWWADVGRVKRTAVLIVLGLLPLATVFALAVMGPRLVREGSLLWFGAHTVGTVREAKVEQSGSFKGGEPKYRLVLAYEFSTPDGRRHVGTGIRNDLRYLPNLPPGSPIGVFYDAANPARSVVEYNLRTDVYALVLFLPFLGVVSFGFPLWYALKLARVLRQRSPGQAR